LDVDNAVVNIFEGQTAQNSGTLGDLSATLAASLGDLTHDLADPSTWDWSFDGLDDLAETIAITATNSNDAQATVSFDLNVVNVAPSVTVASGVGELVLAVGESAAFGGTLVDPGVLDTHSAEWTFSHRDANGLAIQETRAGTVTNRNITDNFSFSEAGVYTVTLTVIDDDGGVATSTESIFVVYDPSEGFVTGGGWIDSPAAAYVGDPLLTGKANFGFVSKYKKGAKTPTGTTEFQFSVANFNFHSTTYDWLVVAGARAQFKGIGAINGFGNYGFLLTAIDGKINGGGGVDKFRIKIWDIGTDRIVYDNKLGASDNDDPTTALGGGQIVIHKGGK
jgi:hypothetical protein